MGDLVEFLRARLAEYETETRSSGDGRVIAEREWLLADIESKRHILNQCVAVLADMEDRTDVDYYGAGDLAEATLRALALPYADRPGYRPEWRLA